MFYRTLVWGMWLGILLPTGSSAAELRKGVIGILGESSTFWLKSPRPFDTVFWQRNEIHVASLFWKSPCQLRLFETHKNWSVTVSQDCSSLTIKGLRKEDSAGYKAHLMKDGRVFETQIFTLKVYKRLSEADLDVVCVKGIPRGEDVTLHLSCSVGQWEDGVEFSWSSFPKTGVFSSQKTSLLLFDIPQDDDGNVTCTARNPVSNASRTVALKQTCDTEEPRGLSSEATFGVMIAALIVVKVMISACVFARVSSRTQE